MNEYSLTMLTMEQSIIMKRQKYKLCKNELCTMLESVVSHTCVVFLAGATSYCSVCHM